MYRKSFSFDDGKDYIIVSLYSWFVQSLLHAVHMKKDNVKIPKSKRNRSTPPTISYCQIIDNPTPLVILYQKGDLYYFSNCKMDSNMNYIKHGNNKEKNLPFFIVLLVTLLFLILASSWVSFFKELYRIYVTKKDTLEAVDYLILATVATVIFFVVFNYVFHRNIELL
jgi:hypothetical protein